MAEPRFKVGQRVTYTPAQIGMETFAKFHQIVRPLPLEGGQRFYRIKAPTEVFERVAAERELAATT